MILGSNIRNILRNINYDKFFIKHQEQIQTHINSTTRIVDIQNM